MTLRYIGFALNVERVMNLEYLLGDKNKGP